MPNPQIPLGTLNRLRASVVWSALAQLNVTASFLAPEGIRLSFGGVATQMLPGMTGAVTSPEPYQLVSMTVHLLKSQNLGALYKAQLETNTLLGDCQVIPDASTLTPYALSNCALANVRELDFSGGSALYAVEISGTYQINSALWDQG